MRIFKPVMKIVVFVVLLVLINEACNFALEPIGSASDTMWSDYVKEEDLDMVYTGSSFSLRAFNPYIIDEALGTNSYNMGTPMQAINQTYVAIKTAIEEHNLDTVILALNYSTLEFERPAAAKVAFYRAKGQNEPFIERMLDMIMFTLDEDNRTECTSINFLFPWIYNHVNIDRNSIITNIRDKMAGKTEETVTEGVPESVYVGKGFGYYVGELDYNTIGNMNSKTSYTNVFFADAFEVIIDIIELCKKNDVELIAVNVPRPALDIVSYGEDYFVKYERIRQLFAENGAVYFDFNLIKPEIMEIKEEYFVDIEHFNEEGTKQFSASFAKFLQLYKGGENMEQFFYSPEEYLQTINYITNTYFEAQMQEDGILLEANAYHGTGVVPEYEFSLWDDKTDTYTVIREYSKEREFLFKPTEQADSYYICVKARQVGDKIEYERFYKMEVVAE